MKNNVVFLRRRLQLLGGGVVPPVVAAVDPYFNYVTALLHGDGTNGGQNNTFLDSSTNNFTITRNGNTTQGSFSPFSQTGWGNYFDGSGDALTLPSNAALALGAGDFTVEAWVYNQNGIDLYPNITSNSGSIVAFLPNAGGTYVSILSDDNYPGSGNATLLTATATIPQNTWTHVAWVRSGSTITVYINGIASGTATSAANHTREMQVVGAIAQGAAPNFYFWKGYISNLRIVKGTAVYTGAFTPSTAPLTAIANTSLLTCQSNRFIDNSTNNFAITRNGDVSVQPYSPFNPTTAYSASTVGGSGYFDGSGDYLTAADNAALELGSGDWTLECWYYQTATQTYSALIGKSGTAAQFASYLLQINSLTPTFYLSTSGSSYAVTISSSINITNSNWNHLAVVRSGNTITLYVNGVSGGTAAYSSTPYDGSYSFAIGAYGDGSYPINGYVANARLVKGTAVYTTAFTPPTAPLTAIANTQLLCNFTNGAIYDNAAVADYETVGNAQISTSVKKYGTGSMLFDGTGDYLSTPFSQLCRIMGGDFTIEMWVYLNAAQANMGLVSSYSSNNGWIARLDTSAIVFAYGTGSAATVISNSASLSTGVWYHIAFCKIGSSLKTYVNGTQVGTTATISGAVDTTATGLQIGRTHTVTNDFNGYIDDLRISNGVARYPYNFIPPDAELPNIGGTITLTADPYFENTTLLLSGNGANGAQNNTFVDGSTNNFTITRNGNTTQGTFSPFSQTGWGAYFNGSSDYISVADSADFTMGSGDFTVQCWVYSTANSGSDQYILGQVNSGGTAAATSFQLYKKATSNVAEAFVYAGGAKVATGTAQIPVGQWTHLAMVRDGGTLRLYVNGSQDGTNATLSTTAITDSAGSFSVGRTGDYNGLYFAGYVSNVSVVKGTCLFPSGTTFTPSTTPLSTSTSGQSVLLCQANRFIDTNTATTAKTVTVGSTSYIQAFSPFNPTASWDAATNGGSGYFDGSGDYLSVASDAAFGYGTGDFTIEFWVYRLTDPLTSQVYLDQRINALTIAPMIFTDSATLYYRVGGTNVISGSISGKYLKQWTHIAVARSGTSTKLFFNGAQLGSTYTDTNNYVTSPVLINSLFSPSLTTNSYFSDLRIVKGTALYTAAFTPPTAPLTAITNTSLLCNFTNAGIYDATAKNDLETVGNAQISTTQSKFGGSSMYFDGTGDYLLAPWNPLTDLGAGDFTIEFWMYPTAVGQSSITYLFNLSTSGAYGPILIGQAASGYGIVLYSSSTGSSWNLANGSSFGTATANAWNHVALTRYGADVRLFLNGVIGTTLNWGTTALLTGSTYRTNVGSATGVANTFYTGYMQDLRVTKGIARYTTGFTPPTAALPVL